VATGAAVGRIRERDAVGKRVGEVERRSPAASRETHDRERDTKPKE
jgi:hypothetical protein